jgi:cell division protein FtsL
LILGDLLTNITLAMTNTNTRLSQQTTELTSANTRLAITNGRLVNTNAQQTAVILMLMASNFQLGQSIARLTTDTANQAERIRDLEPEVREITRLTTTNDHQTERIRDLEQRIRDLEQQIVDEQNKVRLFKIYQWPLFIEVTDFT